MVNHNNPALAGKLVSTKALFGADSRYAVGAVHTRFDAVEWFVWDAETPDTITGHAGVIRQAATKEEALAGLL